MTILPKLFIGIRDLEIYFITGYVNEQNNFELLEKSFLAVEEIRENKILDLDKIINIIKKNILSIEEKVNYTFKDVIVILDFFDKFYVNLSGFKKLNGTQISKENVTYILNFLKSSVETFEPKKKIIHIFNSRYTLDKKKIDNLPIGLFGDVYTHEISFNMIKRSDYKNLKLIFEKCNLKIKKILFESFIKGTLISEMFPNTDTFYYIKLNDKDAKIIFVENDAVKYEQKFKFGTDIIIKDIFKVTHLNTENIIKIVNDHEKIDELSESEILEEKYFKDVKFRKIKKTLIKDIARARIKELSEIIFSQNINFKTTNLVKKTIFLEIKDKKHLNCFKNLYRYHFSDSKKFELKFLEETKLKDDLIAADKIVQFGWKKEAIPVSDTKKSIIASFFGRLFNN